MNRTGAAPRLLCGTCSWTDPTLTKQTDWYPSHDLSAEERLRFYAEHFPVVEVDATYYRPPAEQQSRLWVERTPDGFRFHVKAFALFTGHPTRPQSLWKDIREALPGDLLEKRNLYAHHLPSELLDEAWQRFRDALAPLHAAGRLATILFQFPPWFTPRRDNREELERLADRLGGMTGSVEFRSPRWTSGEPDRERTLRLLEEHGLVHVGVDAPPVSGLPRLLAATTPELLMVRFHGRADDTWSARNVSAAERFRYLYSPGELRELADEIAAAAGQTAEAHLLMNNCYRDYGVRNAAELRDLLGAR